MKITYTIFFILLIGFTNSSYSSTCTNILAEKIKVSTNIDKNFNGTTTIDGRPFRKVSRIDRLDFKHLEFNEKGISKELTFEVPEDGVSFSITLSGEPNSNRFEVYELIDPNGVKIVDSKFNNNIEVSQSYFKVPLPQWYSLSPIHPNVFRNLSSAVVPANPRVKITPGKWTLKVWNTEVDKPMVNSPNVSLVIKISPLEYKSKIKKVLKLNVFMTENTVLGNTSEILTLADLKNRLLGVIMYFKMHDIEIQIESKNRIPESLSQAQITNSAANLEFLKIMSEYKNEDHSINMFFLDPKYSQDVERPELYGVNGIATFAGAGIQFGSDQSYNPFVVIRNQGTNGKEVVIAHELGHLLGLRHTNMDFLEDTHTVEHLLTGNSDSHEPNLMHAENISMVPLSLKQKEIIHSSPGLIDYISDQ